MTLNNLFRVLKQNYHVYFLALWIVFVIELLSRGQLKMTLQWIFQHFGLFLFNGLIIGSLILFLSVLTGRTRLSYWIVAVFSLIIAFINGIKLKILGVPLLPWDFILTSEVKDMTPYIHNLFEWHTITVVVLFIGISILLLHRTVLFKHQLQWKEKIVLSIVTVCLFSFLLFELPISYKSLFKIESIQWNQTTNVSQNGFMLASLMNIENFFIDKKKYDIHKVQTYMAHYDHSDGENKDKDGVKPDIIVVLSETFWDPTIIEDIEFSQDPLPFFHTLQKNYPNGWLLSPQFGGGTANVEFEVLTGHSMRFLPQGSIPYNQYITQGIDSLASITSRQGYQTAAISPFHSWYFKSRDAYRYLGFDKYISIEFFDPVYSGPYIADSEVAKLIIEETERDPGPHFIFANTMENHYHYYPGKFEKNTISVSGQISPESKGLFETYAQGTSAADQMLRTLVEHYSNKKKPVMIIFFGDHLPVLGDQYKAYIESNYISGEDDPDFLFKMYKVPFVIWDNFSEAQQESLFLSSSFLGPQILERAGLPLSPFMQFLKDMYNDIPVIPPQDYYTSMNIHEEDLKQYMAIQHDVLFGKRLSYTSIQNNIVSPKFMLGADKVSITKVTPELIQANQNVTLQISGSYLPALGVVHFNNQPLKTHAGSRNKLIAELPYELAKVGQGHVDVRVIDSENTVVAQSNSVEIQIK